MLICRQSPARLLAHRPPGVLPPRPALGFHHAPLNADAALSRCVVGGQSARGLWLSMLGFSQ